LPVSTNVQHSDQSAISRKYLHNVCTRIDSPPLHCRCQENQTKGKIVTSIPPHPVWGPCNL
jgi:hypothetical protein